MKLPQAGQPFNALRNRSQAIIGQVEFHQIGKTPQEVPTDFTKAQVSEDQPLHVIKAYPLR
ncbi:hypothetical protein D3C71_2090000 [compost metagenome]